MKVLICLACFLLGTQASFTIEQEHEPELGPKNDDIGPPLNAKDFKNAETVVSKPPNEFTLDQPDLFEGDIAGINPDDPDALKNALKNTRPKRNAFKDPNYHWPKGVIPYTISKAFSTSERAIIAQAVQRFKDHTCIRFVAKKNEKDYVSIVKGPRCKATIGRMGGRQEIAIGPRCFFTLNVMHELMHTLGFLHEQGRPDRDKYISIQWDAILPRFTKAFQKYPEEKVTTLDQPYDFKSIMHYPTHAFTKEMPWPTIKSLNKKNVIARGDSFSDGDILKINKLYKCDGAKNELDSKIN